MAGLLLVSLAAVLWGTVGVANNLMEVRNAVDPMLAGFVRTTLGAASLLIAAKALRLPWAGTAFPVRLLAGFGLAGALFQSCLFAAYDHAGVTVTVAVTVCAPVALVVAAEALWRRRWPAAGTSAAIAIASLGVALAVAGGSTSDANDEPMTWIGVALLAVASIAYAVVAATARIMARDLHPLRATGLGLGVTAAVLGLAVLVRPDVGTATLGLLPARDLAILAYIGVAATGGAYLAFVLGLHLSRTAASGLAATLIEPAVAALLAALVLSERLGGAAMLGCLLMAAGMVVLYSAERRVRPRKRPALKT